MVTMKEIANKAGVSVSTVSLVLNGRDEGRVKSKIADNVRAIATKLGYQSNPLASSLRTGRTHILGFISEEVATTPYAGGMILGAQTAASQFGYMLITVSTDGENSESEEIAALKRYGTDGFLYAKMSNRITHVPSSLAKTPLVLVDATDSLGKIPSVEPDEFQIGYDATTRLVKAGCARIAYVGCLEPLIAQDDRLEGYQAALRDAGLDYDDHLVVNVLNNGPALTAVSDLFDAEHPDGFFCFNDARAWYVYECAARRGLTVGKDSRSARTSPWSAWTTIACSPKRWNRCSPLWNCRISRWATGPWPSWCRLSKDARWTTSHGQRPPLPCRRSTRRFRRRSTAR